MSDPDVRQDGSRVDGRTARRDRNRRAVLDAVVELFRQGRFDPGVHEVAQHSGVSLRSVYRYFEDADELMASAIRHQLDDLQPLFHVDGLGTGTLDDRIHRLSMARVALHERADPVLRAAAMRSAVDDRVASRLTATHRHLHGQTAQMFEPEISGDTDLEVAVGVLTQLETIGHVRHVHELAPAQLRAFLGNALQRLLRPRA